MAARTFRFFVHDFRNGLTRAHVDLGKVEYDETGYFWMANEYEDRNGAMYPKRRLDMAKIPVDLAFYEFHDLDAENFDELLDFQQRYGLLTSIFRTYHSGLAQPGQSSKVLDATEYFAYDLQTIQQTFSYFAKYDPEEGRHKPTREDYKHSRFAESSLEEVRMCVKRLQWATDVLLDARPESGRDAHNPKFISALTETLVASISDFFPLVEYTQDCFEPRPMPLSALLVAQLLASLCDEEAFHICAYEACGRRFQWKRNGNGVAGRRTGSKYCCEDHQIRQKRINQQRRRHAEAQRDKGDTTGTP